MLKFEVDQLVVENLQFGGIKPLHKKRGHRDDIIMSQTLNDGKPCRKLLCINLRNVKVSLWFHTALMWSAT